MLKQVRESNKYWYWNLLVIVANLCQIYVLWEICVHICWPFLSYAKFYPIAWVALTKNICDNLLPPINCVVSNGKCLFLSFTYLYLCYEWKFTWISQWLYFPKWLLKLIFWKMYKVNMIIQKAYKHPFAVYEDLSKPTAHLK